MTLTTRHVVFSLSCSSLEGACLDNLTCVSKEREGQVELFLVLFILAQKRSLLLIVGCHKMLSTALDFLMFQLHFDGLECCLSLQGDFVFFSLKKKKKPPLSHFTLDCISSLLLPPNLWGFNGGFSKIIPSKRCQCSWRSVSCHRVEADIDLVVVKQHHTALFSAHSHTDVMLIRPR